MNPPHRTVELLVVIPTLNEEARLPLLLQDLAALSISHRVVVCDGGSTDDTREIAASLGAVVVESVPGRGIQMHRAAWSCTAPWILFLHADSRFPGGVRHALAEVVQRLPVPPEDEAFHFRFRLQESGPGWRLLEWGQWIREGATGLVYGDQGLLLGRSLYERSGGFPPLPIMEDVEMVQRLRECGARTTRLDADLPTSGRRYVQDGRIRGVLRNALLMGRYVMGQPPAQLGPRVRPPQPRRPPDPTGDAHRGRVLIYAKAPRVGTVKTRLGRDLGDEAACMVHRRLVERTVSSLAHLPYPLELRFTPDDSLEEMQDWLIPWGVDRFAPQGEGDLGARMESGLTMGLSEVSSVCLVGTDLPGISQGLVLEAFSALAGGSHLVLGPALDGGYYLLAAREAHPDLFRGMLWSQPQVLEETLERAQRLSLRVHLLPPLRDVDTLQDLRIAAPELIPPPGARAFPAGGA